MADPDVIMIDMTVVTCALSLLGSIFNWLTTIYVKASSPIIEKMVIYLSIADIIYDGTGLIQLLTPISGDFFCQTITLINYFGFGSSISLTCCFAHILYVTLNSETADLEKHLRHYQIISLGFGLYLGVLSVVTRIDEISDGYCVYHLDPGGFDWAAWLVLLIPLIISVLLCGAIYVAVIYKLKELGNRIYLELLLYPIILVICYLPLVVVSLIPNPWNWFEIVAFPLSNCQGLLNAFAYGLSKKIVDGYRNKCCKKRKECPSIDEFDLNTPRTVSMTIIRDSITITNETNFDHQNPMNEGPSAII